jgi:polyribonucleotide nucleotidyltransferase
MLEALKFGHEQIAEFCNVIDTMVKEVEKKNVNGKQLKAIKH